MNGILSELRYAARSLWRTPRFTLLAALTLALGIGINTGVFAVLDAVLFRPLPYDDPARLISLWEITPKGARFTVAPGNLADYRGISAFESLAGVQRANRNLTGAGTAERLNGLGVTANYLNVLGVRPGLGRFFTPEEDRPGSNRVAVISHALWTSRFGSDRAVLGRPIQLDGIPHIILGVMSENFQSPSQIQNNERIDVFVPAAYDAALLANRGDHEIEVVGRLRPGASVERAQSELDALTTRLGRQYPDFGGFHASIRPLADDLTRNVRASLRAILAAVAFILLIACVNVANLFLVRAAEARRDIALRRALGASRWRIVRGLLAQSVLLSGGACAVGLLLGVWCKDLLVAIAPSGIPRLASAAVDARVVLFAVALSMATGILFGLAPAWQGTGSPLAHVLKSSERMAAGTGLLRTRNVLVVSEIALALLLLTGGILLLRSFLALHSVDLGYQPDRVLAQTIMMPAARYKDNDAKAAFFDQLAARVSIIPGITAVAYANQFPLRGGWGSGIQTEDGPPERREADFQAVSPGYFHTLGIAILKGRGLSVNDRKGSEPVAVVSAVFAAKFFPGHDAIGRRFRRGPSQPWISIVGISGDIRRAGKHAEVTPQVYLAAAQTNVFPVGLSDFAVRTAADPIAIGKAIQKEVWALDPDQPVTAIRTLGDIANENTARQRVLALLSTLFAGLGVALAMIGVYGVVSYSVARRRAELGIRLALGAESRDLLHMVLRQSAILALIGLAIGIPLSLALSRYLKTLLFGVTPSDAPTFVIAAVSLACVAVLAALGPALQAAKTNPIEALRYE
jgi:putative ABC transport system permease protein